MKIDVVGSGSAFSKTNNTSSILIEDDQGIKWLIDCGPTVPRALFQRGLDVNEIKVIYFTHIHPDHSTGLTALINNWKSFNRSESLDIYCQLDQQEPLKGLVALAIWPETEVCFDIRWHDIEDVFSWPLTQTDSLNQRVWKVETAYTQHEISNRSLKIRLGDCTLFYSGDGRATEETKRLMKGADVAFQECASFVALSDNSSHGDLPDCIGIAEALDLKSLGIYHCWDEEISLLKQVVNKRDNMFLSYDGLTIDLMNGKT
ncbi:MBL fold metallo-hydrolase [Marinomonas balearica]|uniref:Ribonuclease BN (tRNA processing enzyme) n=1 Tax=Marinomonas balearica TaxID=491947 RepID=A0A4R6MBJ1_9GAMM|nr:ribonuclease Z [Marinomonas balearica]TDO98971.1 ribonuclease BN (tRNA processing enzyme) [Marinomonas balearica]